MMDSFIQQFMLDDVSICDQLIDYHTNNMEYKSKGSTAAGMGKGKVSTDVPIYVGSQNAIVHMYVTELMKKLDAYLQQYSIKFEHPCQASLFLFQNLCDLGKFK